MSPHQTQSWRVASCIRCRQPTPLLLYNIHRLQAKTVYKMQTASTTTIQRLQAKAVYKMQTANTTTIHRLQANTVYKMQANSPLREATPSQAANTHRWIIKINPTLDCCSGGSFIMASEWVKKKHDILESNKYLSEFSEIYLLWLDRSLLSPNCISAGIIQREICSCLKCVRIIFCWISCGLSVCK